MSAPAEKAALFEAERARLTRLAYRMLGSMADAEEVVQTAYLRFAAAEDIENPPAWLTRTVSRLAIDAWRAARRRREIYVGPFLPEPVVDQEPAPDGALVDAALMLALERLTPLERAAFLLHDVFAVPFEEIAATLGREPAACRQLAARARRHVETARPRFRVLPAEHEALAMAFHDASRSGDTATLASLLAEEVVLVSDGGGVRSAALRPLVGRPEVLRLYEGLAWRHGQQRVPARFAVIDGLPGLVTREADGLMQTTALRIEAGLVSAILTVRNPAKLSRIPPL